tara:strand:- start:16693 stop:18075 length:1383 start_codon:yes stop_codon:yes gene_type:complete
MTNIVIKDHPMAAFARELPALLLRYKLQVQEMETQAKMLDRKIVAEQELKKADREYSENLMHYKDAKSDMIDAKNNLRTTNDSLMKTGADMDLVNELFKTEGIGPLLALSKIKAGNYEAKAEALEKNTEIYKRKDEILKDILYDEVSKASAVLTGGDPELGKAAGGDPEVWDAEDFGYSTYQKMYDPEILNVFNQTGQVPQPFTEEQARIFKSESLKSDIARSVIESRPDLMRKNVAAFKAAELSDMLTAARIEKLGVKDTSDLAEKKALEASQYMQQRLTNAADDSGYNQYWISLEVAQNADGDYDDESVSSHTENARFLKNTIAKELAELRGMDFVENETFVELIFNEYRSIHKQAEGVYQPGIGWKSPPDFSKLEELVQTVYDNYQTKSADAKKRLDVLAKKYFGYTGMTFEEFVNKFNSHVDMNILDVFKDDLDDNNATEIYLNNILQDVEWDDNE